MLTSPLYAIADTAFLGERLLSAAEEALQGGTGWLQYRDKIRTPPQRAADVRALRALCHRYGAKLIVNDDIALALAGSADGVHLGQSDGDPKEARQRLGESAIIGVTCHGELALAQVASQACASYVAFGRFFPSRTKPEAPTAPVALLTQAQRVLDIPIVAIGGISLENGGRLLSAGASRLAVSHDLFSARDIEGRARAYQSLTPYADTNSIHPYPLSGYEEHKL